MGRRKKDYDTGLVKMHRPVCVWAHPIPTYQGPRILRIHAGILVGIDEVRAFIAEIESFIEADYRASAPGRTHVEGD